MSDVHFLSHYQSTNAPHFAGGVGFSRKIKSCISHGASSNSELWEIANHTGTHIDCPFHFDHEGKKLSDYSAKDWIFHCPYLLSIECSNDQMIEPTEVWDEIPLDCDMLLIKTGFEGQRLMKSYWESNPGVSSLAANWLKEKRPGVRAIGFDFISLTAFKNRELGRHAHRAFLGKENGKPICIIEDMKLSTISDSPKQIIVAPLLVENADGAPCTVIALGCSNE